MMPKIKRKIFYTTIHLVVLTLLLLPLVVTAQSAAPSQDIKIDNPFRYGDNLYEFITAVLEKIVMPIAAMFVVFWIIYAGFQFVIAQGNPTKLKTARTNLLWSLIGAGILLGATGIAAVVKTTIESIMN